MLRLVPSFSLDPFCTIASAPRPSLVAITIHRNGTALRGSVNVEFEPGSLLPRRLEPIGLGGLFAATRRSVGLREVVEDSRRFDGRKESTIRDAEAMLGMVDCERGVVADPPRKSRIRWRLFVAVRNPLVPTATCSVGGDPATDWD